MNQIERIRYFEQLYNETINTLMKTEKILEEYEEAQQGIRRLEEYYTGDEWKKDFEDDEKGLIPSEIRRGVLSEDSVYNLLEKNDIVLETIEQIMKKQRYIRMIQLQE